MSEEVIELSSLVIGKQDEGINARCREYRVQILGNVDKELLIVLGAEVRK